MANGASDDGGHAYFAMLPLRLGGMRRMKGVVLPGPGGDPGAHSPGRATGKNLANRLPKAPHRSGVAGPLKFPSNQRKLALGKSTNRKIDNH